MDSSTAIKQFRKSGLLWILFSAIISYILSTTVDMSRYGLGGLINYIWPPVIGLMTFLAFLGLSFIIRNLTVLKVVLVVFCLYNVYVGFALNIEKDYWPLLFI